jgi:hypothetical protein
MRTLRILVIVGLALSVSGIAFAELQNVEVGGKLQIRGNYWRLGDLGASASVEQRTALNVKADFTNDVSTFVEFDSYSDWGQNFRSNYLTGIDSRGAADVSLYQAYINVKDLWGTPLSLRVGRQELTFGAEFLLGNNSSSPYFRGLSFDAIRLSYNTDQFKVDAFAAKLAESFQNFGKGDVDLYGVYGSYIGIENVTLDAYWLYLRDDTIAGKDTNIHTLGLRGSGKVGGFDFEAEVAYQLGSVDGQPSACPLGFGEADVDYGTFGAEAILGYTFDVAWQPHVFGLFAYYGAGEPDNCRRSNDRTLPFNRLFSDIRYSDFVDLNANATNVVGYAAGVQVSPTECTNITLIGKYLDLDENIGKQKGWGWEANLIGTYHYSQDLAFSAGYSHFFGDRWADGSKPNWDYFFAQTAISF